jgi:hypothetical protein
VAKVKFVTLEADLVVTGIVNFNEVDKSVKPGIKRAKKFGVGSESIDYTSANCLKHTMYKRFDQKAFYDAEYKHTETWAKLLGSELGLLRGLMNAQTGTDTLTRKSPVTVLPAESKKRGLVVIENGTTTKASVGEEHNDRGLIEGAGITPKDIKEKELKTKEKDNDDKEKSKNFFSGCTP